MKTLVKYSFSFFLIALGLISCDNDLVDLSQGQKDLNHQVETKALESESEVGDINFLYKGKKYETTYFSIGDSIISYEDETVGELIVRLQSLPSLVTFIFPDNSIEYFEDQNDLDNNLQRVVELSKTLKVFEYGISLYANNAYPTRNRDYIANMHLYDDVGFYDTHREFNIKVGGVVEVSHLKEFDMNDKTSSMILYANTPREILFQFWENDSFKSHSWAISINAYVWGPTGIQGCYACDNLKIVPVEGTKRSSWNDRITSLRMKEV